VNEVNKRNDAEMRAVAAIANSGNDQAVVILNLNLYSAAADFPNGELYKNYISGLEKFLPVVGGEIMWRRPVLGQVTGEQKLHEVIAGWYPTHQGLLDLPQAPGAEENFRLRGLAVEHAEIYRLPGDTCPLMP